MTLDLSLLPDGGVGWLDASGRHADIVLSTRIRLARNVEGYAFTGRARDGERLRVLAQVREAVGSIGALRESVMYRLDELPPTSRALLHERHLVSKELAGLDEQHPLRTGAAGVPGGRPRRDGRTRKTTSGFQALRSGFACRRPSQSIDKWTAI
jgi:protein arginine kinase